MVERTDRPRERIGSDRRLESSGDRSDGFRVEDTRHFQQELLVGQLLEAVKGLRRDSEKQTEAVEKIASKVEEFDRLVHNGRWLLIGMGLASLGMGALASKLVDFLWPG